MRVPMSIVFTVITTAALYGTASAAPAATYSAATKIAPSAGTQADCQKTGSDVSALIDKRIDSANISAARAAFQVGIMECMEGDNSAANQHYQQAKKLLASEQEAPSPAPLQKR
jgi:hypothetical protein